jgi:ADP-dependent NAD(P)H-hydrate dehydratase / NAD(P)H-hydrate epimerase
MATGGMGDVLTGLSAALIAQGMSCFDAGCLGAWLSGRAAEIAITRGGQSIESLAAGDVLHHLGAAFSDLKAGVY